MRLRATKKYLFAYLITTALLLVVTFSFNVIIDPFGVYRLVDIEGVNSVKTGQAHRVRLAKAGAVRAFRPSAVVLGNSRAEYGINPDHPGWSTKPVYNLGISGANIYEILRYFQHANSIQRLSEVLFMLDLNQFDAYWENSIDFTEKRLAVTVEGTPNELYYAFDFVPTTLSLNALAQSISTIWRSSTGRTTTYLRNGQRDWRDDLLFRTVIANFGSYHSLFTMEEESLFLRKSNGRSSGLHAYSYNETTKVNVFDWFRRIVQISIRDGIELRLVLTPSHGRYFETNRLLGDWALWEEWKRTLVSIVEEEAGIAGVEPFPFWDFSGFNPLTVEPVPPASESGIKMKWYFESSHFTTGMGDMIQDRVFGREASGRKVPDYFGVLLTKGNIEDHLAKIRIDNLKFREDQPDVADELLRLASKYDVSSN